MGRTWWQRRGRGTGAMVVDRRALISAPASEVWELVSDAALFARTAAAEHLWTFVVPGTPAGFVGERRVTLARADDDRISATLVERVDMEAGRSVVSRNLTNGIEMTSIIEPLGPSSCELTYRVRATVPKDELEAHVSLASASLDARLERMSAHVAGVPARSEHPARRDHDHVQQAAGRAVAVGTVAAPPAEVWPAVRTTGVDLLDATGQGAASVVALPDTPVGEVGEQICIVASDPPFVQVLEVVAQDVGRSVTVRYLTAPTRVDRTVTLAPSSAGTDVTVSIDFVAPAAEIHEHEARMRVVAETFLRCFQS